MAAGVAVASNLWATFDLQRLINSWRFDVKKSWSILRRYSLPSFGVCAAPHMSSADCCCANACPDLFSLAPYMAWSALLINASAVVPSRGKIETPILASRHGLTMTSRTLTLHGA